MRRNLINAIRSGDLGRVLRLLDSGADLEFRISDAAEHGIFFVDITPLMVAVASPTSHPDIVSALLAAGADIRAVSAGGVSATWYASGGGLGYCFTEEDFLSFDPDQPYRFGGGGNAECLRVILDAGGDPNETASNGRSCVCEACSVGDDRRLKLLIERGARLLPSRPQKSWRQWFTDGLRVLMRDLVFDSFVPVPLFQACLSGNLDCVRLLIEAGVPADFDLGGKNALHYASTAEIASFLWDRGVRLREDQLGFDAIDEAIDEDRIDVLRYLVNQVDRSRIHKALLAASGHKMNPKAVRLLLELGAEASFQESVMGSPLHEACWQGDGNGGRETSLTEETIRILISAGADPNQLFHGSCPLHEAVYGDWGAPTSVRVLLECGAEVDIRNADGRTALMIAASRGDADCVRLLLDAGADRTLQDAKGWTAMDYARWNLDSWSKHKEWRDEREEAEAVVEMLGLKR